MPMSLKELLLVDWARAVHSLPVVPENHIRA